MASRWAYTGLIALSLAAPLSAAAQGLFPEPVSLAEPLLTTGPVPVGATSEQWVPDAFDADGYAIMARTGFSNRFVHYDPTDPADSYTLFNPVFITQRPPNVVRSLGGWTLTEDAEGIWFTGIDDERARLQVIVRGDLEGATVHDFALDEHPDWADLYALLSVESVQPEAAPGTLCFRAAHTLRCADLETGALPVVLDTADLRDVIGSLAFFEGEWVRQYAQPSLPPGLPGPIYPDAYDWTLDDVEFLADGRMFALASLAIAGAPVTLTARALFEIAPDGTISVRYGPLRAAPALDPLGGGTRLMYLPELDALAVYTQAASHGWVAVRGGTGILHEDQLSQSRPHGWQGHGLHLFPLGAPGHGLLDLTDAVIRRLECAEGGTALGCRLRGPRLLLDRGALRVLLPHVPVANDFSRAFTTVHALEFDPMALDLDADGLTAAEEQAAGTSDYLADSDGGGTDDQDEVLRSGTDPMDPTDDPAHDARQEGFVTLLSSPMIRMRVDYDVGPGMTSWDAYGPLCTRGACFGPDGAPVLRFDDVPEVDAAFDPIRSADGTHVMLRTTDGFTRVFFADGRRAAWIEHAALRDALPRAAGDPPLVVDAVRIVPVDAERTWAVSEVAPARVVLFEGEAPRVMFDAVEARCAAGLGPCDAGPMPDAPDLDHSQGPALPGGGLPYPDVPVHDVDDVRLAFVGYEPRTGELLIAVYGSWQTYLIALHPDAPPRVVATERELQRGAGAGPPFVDERVGHPTVPTGWRAIGDRLRLTDVGFRHPLGAPVPGSIERFPHYGAIATAWGDTTVYRVYTGGAEDGLYELVRHDGALAPDDLVLATWGQAHIKGPGGDPDCPLALRVFHGKPRGGLAERITRCAALPGSVVTSGTLVDGVAGVDVSAEGALCIADGARVLTFVGAASTGGFPQIPLYDAPLAGAIDCAWRGGQLFALTADAVVHRFDPAAGFAPTKTLSAPDDLPPSRFVRLPDGDPAVVFEVGDNRRAQTLDGAAVDPAELAAALGAPEPQAAWSDGLRSDAIDIRRDGSRLVARDLYTGAEAPYAWENLAPPGSSPAVQSAYAIVPGGTGRDPWTGMRRAAPAPGGEPPPQGPARPMSDGGGGCRAVPGAPAGWGWSLIALVALARRRR